MALDSETKRVSALNTATFHPGKLFMPSEPDGCDLDSNAERGFVMWHYAGIDAAVLKGPVRGSLQQLGVGR